MPVAPRQVLKGEFSRRSLSVTVNVRIAGDALPFRGQVKTALASRGYAGLLTIKILEVSRVDETMRCL